MTKEELEHDHIKKISENYVNESWGSFADLSGVDLVMAGIGVAKIISKEKEKRIEELEEKISVLLSCKNCPQNKGGYICAKEYENKCLAQKIQFIKELQEENAELKDYRLTTLAKQQTGMSKYALNLEHKLSWYDDQLTKAKEIIKSLLQSFYGWETEVEFDEIDNSRIEQAEQFLSEVKK